MPREETAEERAERLARLRPADEAFLARLRQLGIDPAAPRLDTARAERAIGAYLVTHDHVLDRWGNWRPGNAEAPVKLYVKSRVLVKEVKGDQDWIKVKSLSSIDAATGWIAAAARNAGDASADGALAAARARKQGKKKASVRRHIDLARAIARQRARKILLSGLLGRGLRQEAEAALARGDVELPGARDLVERAAQAEIESLEPILAEIEARGGREPSVDDAGLFSLDQPPPPWLLPVYFHWVEEGHDVAIDGDDARFPFVIGRTGHVGIDPVAFQPQYKARFAGRHGDGWIGGRLHPPGRRLSAVEVTTVGSIETGKKGVGRALVKMAARMARGLGDDRLLVTSITTQGEPFWDRLESTGELVLLGRPGHAARLYRIGSVTGAPRALAASALLARHATPR